MTDEPLPQVSAASWEQQVLRAGQPVLVEFNAAWCGPCRLQTRELGELASDLAGRLAVVQVDIDGEEELARRYDVRAVPALLLFRGGEVVVRISGLTQGDPLRDQVLPHLDG